MSKLFLWGNTIIIITLNLAGDDSMLNGELHKLVAENCNQYVDKFSMTSNMLSSNCNTCSRCINYKNGMCTKNMFNVMKEIISIG
ncbi:hypothetical protein [Hathewaya limosa]|nr:hypothetical protein [Hathewaya limosa]AWZ47385.1 hypothetical protein C3495_00245 [Clostridiaceae bacterium 14S0207]